MKNIRKLGLGLTIPALLLALTGCYYSTESDQIGVHVNGYKIIPTGKSVADCKQPSTSGKAGLGDTVYKYPAGQRTFKFEGKTMADAVKLGADAPAVTVVTNNIPLSLTGTITFYLNTDCKTLEAFHKNIGVKKWGSKEHAAWISNGGGEDYSGWNAMLISYIGQPLQQALTDAILSTTTGSQPKYTYLDLYNGEGRDSFAQAVQQRLPAAVKQIAGGDYFKNFTVTLQKPTIPDDLVTALTSKVTATLQNQAQKTANKTVNTELKSIKHLVKVLGPQGYLSYKQNQLLQQAITKGGISLLPVPEGSSITVPTK